MIRKFKLLWFQIGWHRKGHVNLSYFVSVLRWRISAKWNFNYFFYQDEKNVKFLLKFFKAYRSNREVTVSTLGGLWNLHVFTQITRPTRCWIFISNMHRLIHVSNEFLVSIILFLISENTKINFCIIDIFPNSALSQGMICKPRPPPLRIAPIFMKDAESTEKSIFHFCDLYFLSYGWLYL